MDITVDFRKGFFHIVFILPRYIIRFIVLISRRNQRLMIIAMYSQFSSHIKKISTICKECIPPFLFINRFKWAFYLIPVAFNDDSCIF